MMKLRQRESSSRTSDLMEIDNNLEKTDKKLGDKISSPNNKSSLSLHISAYENSLDIVKANEKKGELKEAESKNDSFNFPLQQQQNENNRVETMEFRLSTKLLNPHPLVTASELNSANEGEIDDEKEYAEIKAKSLQSLVVVIPDSKPKPSKIKKNLNELKTKISTEKSLIKKNLVTLDKDILRSIEIEKRIMDEICERIRERQIVSNRLIDDLRHYQKRTLNSIKARSDALKNYQKLENEEDEIRLNLMEMERNDLW
uniref:Uncharacterized protein n=1 Tax=Panagrolaimus davidi TaxID=227884 RepID=A0A914P1M3_9BILA